MERGLPGLGCLHHTRHHAVDPGRLRYVKDHDDRHFRELEQAPHTGLWWPESDKLRHIIETTAETCEKYEIGEMSASEAAAIINQMMQESDIVNPVFGWKDLDHRFVAPSTLDMARFMYWASRKGAPEWNQLGREFLKGILKAGVKARKVL